MRINTDTSQCNSGLFRDDRGDIGYDTYIIVSYYTQRNGILCSLRFTRPTCFYDTISETFAQVACIRAVATVYLDAAAYGNKPEDLISINRITTACQLSTSPFRF